MSSLAIRYVMAFVAAGLALIVRLSLDQYLEPGRLEYIIFLASAMFVSWYSGLGPALLALGLGAAAIAYFRLVPLLDFGISNPQDQTGLAVYLVLGVVALLGHSIYRARQRAKVRLEWLGTLVKATAQIIWTTDPKGHVIEDSPSWRTFTGQTYDQWKGQGWLNAVHPNDREQAAKSWFNAIAHKTIYQTEYRVRTKNDDYRWMAVRAIPLLESNGRVWQWIGMNTDIHDQKQAEEALRESEERFRATFHQTAVGMAQTDLDGRHIQVNNCYCQITGYNQEELLAKTFLDITHPDDLKQNQEKLRQLLSEKTQTYYEIEKRYIHKDGNIVWVHMTVSLVRDAFSNPRYLISTMQDISERKRQEHALRFLVDLNVATQSLTKPEEIMAVTARMLGEYLGADRCAYAESEPDEDNFTVTSDHTRGVPSLVGKFSLSSFGVEALRLMRANKSYVVDDVDSDQRIRQADLPVYRQTQIQALIWVPLHKAGRFVAAMAIHQHQSRHWLPNEIELVELVVGRCWESIERARTVRDLREIEQQQRFIMDSMPQKIFTARPDGTMEYFNPQWMAFTGLSFEEIKDWGWVQLIHPDDVEANVRAWQNAINTGEPLFQFEHRFRRADGEYRWHVTRALPMRDAEDRIAMWIGSNTDIHDVKQAEEAAVRRSEQVRRLANVATRLNATHDIASLINIVTEEARDLIGAHQSMTSFTVNENWERAINIISLSDKYAKWLNDDLNLNGSGVYSLVCRLNKPMRMTQAELEHPAWKGFGDEAEKRPPLRGLLAAPLVGRDGGNIGLIQLSDKNTGEFTEDDEAILVQMAQMISVAIENARLVEDLRDASRRKDEFLATLAHELRNPLAPLRNMLEIMKRTNGDGTLLEQARAMMDRQLIHMVRLIDDLLDLSRVSKGKLQLRLERVELAAVVSQAAEACRELIRDAGHELNIELPPDPIYLHADPARLTQVFDNLINNACKYTEPGGKISLAAERQNDNIAVKISDTGIGIPPDKLSRIFDMFAQVDHSPERLQAGLGIGLTLVKQLTEMHGGTITAHSDGPGQGSEFVVRLPELKEASHPQNQPSQVGKEPQIQPRRVLVVDDNRDNAESLAILLKMTGNETQTVYDGVDAIRAAEGFHPDLILLDIGLPRLNGYETCRRIRQQSWGKDMVIVAVSGWGQEQDRHKSQEAGFDHHLVKPVNLADLMKLLTKPEPAVLS